MNSSDLDRRGFFGTLAAGALTVTGVEALGSLNPSPLLGASAEAAHGSSDYDDSWTDRVRAARHKAVFDSPEVEDGMGLFQAWIYRSGYRVAQHASAGDVVPVVVLRHMGTALAFDDALWAKYEIGKRRKVDDPATKQPAVRNPFARQRPDIPVDSTLQAALGQPIDTTVEGLVKSGAVVLACELAMKSFARGIAESTKGDPAAIVADLRAGVVPGVIVQPSGVYAVTRAQEVGCSFMRSS